MISIDPDSTIVATNSFSTNVDLFLNILGNIFTVVASGVAMYLFFTQRQNISSAFKSILNYSHQLSMNELYSKLDRLNELNANNEPQRESVLNIFGEIKGQIRGNKRLKESFAEILKDMEPYCSQKYIINEPQKRIFVSQIRETIRNYDIDLMEDK